MKTISGEAKIKFQGQEYTLCLTNKQVQQLENQVGSLYALVRECASQTASYTKVREVMQRAFRKADPQPELKEIPEMLDAMPPRRLYRACTELLTKLLWTDEEMEAEEREQAEAEEEGEGTTRAKTAPLSSATDD